MGRRLVFIAGVTALVATALFGCARDAAPSTSASASGLESAAYRCGSEEFTPDVATPTIRADLQTAAVAARDAVVARLPSLLPASGWRPIAVADNLVTFAAPARMGLAPYVFVRVASNAIGWAAEAYGDCVPATDLQTSLYPGRWWLARPQFAPTDQAISLIVEANYCSDSSIGPDELVGPTIDYTTDRVEITFWVRKRVLDGSTTTACGPPSIELRAFEVALAEPLGGRSLFDAAYPDATPYALPAGAAPTPTAR